MNTMFAFGAVYARGTFEMSLEEVIMFAIAMNVTAGIGAASFGWIDDYLGSKKTIAIALGGLICFGIPLLLVETKLWFWVFGLLLGLFMGPAQAASRSMMARIAPAESVPRCSAFSFFGAGDGLCWAVCAGHADLCVRFSARRYVDHCRLSLRRSDYPSLEGA